MISKTSHDIKHRKHADDDFTTPEELSKSLIKLVPAKKGDWWIDPFAGSGNFFNNFPSRVLKSKGDIKEGWDFFYSYEQYDWIVSNPPYSVIDDVLKHTVKLADKGFAYLLHFHSLTPKRIEMIEQAGFGLTKIHFCKVFNWYGISAFCVFEKGKKSIVSYDRVVWR